MSHSHPPEPGQPLRVAIIAFDGISPFHLSVPGLVFKALQDVAARALVHYEVCAMEKGSLRTSAGFDIEVHKSLSILRHADVVIMPSWLDPAHHQAPQALLQALQKAHQRGALMVGLCLGAFVLGDAGLLDGRSATTHWQWADVFAQRFPSSRFDADVLYLEDNGVVTSAGTAASLDCCLYLVREWFGAELANRVARRLVLAPHRAGGQAQFVEQPVPAAASDARLQELLEWLLENLGEQHSIDTLASRIAMSRRTFTRHFQNATGSSVMQWLQHQRLTGACRWLEGSNRSVEAIATDMGFQSAMNLRLHFKAAYGMTPMEYRKQFQTQKPSLQAA